MAQHVFCPICGKEFTGKKIAEVRESWLAAGGFGFIPLEARVHPACNRSEMARIRRGEIKLSYLWVRREGAQC